MFILKKPPQKKISVSSTGKPIGELIILATG